MDAIESANIATENANANLLVLLIPSRATATGQPTFESMHYDDIAATLTEMNIPALDLRIPFRAHPDPASLYYTVDGHWNSDGMALAGDAILSYLRERDPSLFTETPPSSDES